MKENIIIYLKRNKETEINYTDNIDIYTNNKEKLIVLGKCLDKNYKRIYSKDIYENIKNNNYEMPDIRKFNGIFSIIYFDKNNKIYFCNDKNNISKLYYIINDNELYISNSVDNIVKCTDKKLNIDFTAWAEFACLYYVLGNKTFFKEIKSMYYRETICFDLKSWNINSYIEDSLSTIEVNTSLTYEEAVEKCALLIEESINNIFKNTKNIKKVITLSGGWDSRVIAASASKIEKQEIQTLTTNIDNGDNKEERFAKLVADYLGIENKFIDIDKNYYLNELNGQYLNDTDYFSTMHIPFWNFYKKYPLNDKIILDGIYGDLFFRGMALPKTKYQTGTDEYFDEIFKILKKSKLKKHMPPAIKTGLTYLSKNSMREELKRCNYNIKLFVMTNRSKNIGFTGYKQNENNTVLFPFDNEKLIKYVFSLPNEIVFNSNFYPDIMEKIYEGISKIPSTNTKNISDKEFAHREIYRLSNDVKEFFKNTFYKHYEQTNGFYDPILLQRLLEWNKNEITLKNYKDLELFLFYQLWLDNYKNNLVNKNAIDYIEEHTKNNDIMFNQDLTIIYNNDDRKKEMNKWLDFYHQNKKNNNKLDFLCTMDVEAFMPQDLRSIHTTKNNYVEKLILGKCNDEIGYTLDAIIKNKEVPFTFFTEIYSNAYIDENQYKDILKLCSSNNNEAAIHCHPFSLSKKTLDEIGIDFWAHTKKEGFEKIIQYGVDKYKKAIGKTPTTYRAGSFEVYDGHFDALSKAGIKIDSSLYYNNIHNFSNTGKYIKNNSYYIGDVYEIPVTSYNKIKANNTVRFDLNSTSFKEKLELISRSLINNTDYLMMLCHSWSFLQYDKYTSTSNLYHTDFSKNTYDEFMYMLDFLNNTEAINFSTCEQYFEKNEIKHTLVDIIEKPIDTPVYILPPQYGQLRSKTNSENFIDLSNGKFIENESYEYYNEEHDNFELKLNLNKVPQKFDKTEYTLNIPYYGDKEVHLEFILQNKYYNAKMQERNTIKISILVNNELKFYDYITNPKFNDYMYVPAKAINNNINLNVKLECLENEKPWSWPNASRINFHNLYLEENNNLKENRFILFRDKKDVICSLTKNINIENIPQGFKMKYKKVIDENNYVQLFDNMFTLAPSKKYYSYCTIPSDKKIAVVNFKASNQKGKSILNLFFMTYDDKDGNRISNESKKIILENNEVLVSKQFDIKDMSKLYKIAIKLTDDNNEDEINIQDLEVVFY